MPEVKASAQRTTPNATDVLIEWCRQVGGVPYYTKTVAKNVLEVVSKRKTMNRGQLLSTSSVLEQVLACRFPWPLSVATGFVADVINRAIGDQGYNCRDCGACCSPNHCTLSVNLTSKEAMRIERLYPGSIDPYYDSQAPWVIKQRAIGDTKECKFYGGKGYGCTIYKNRPEVCKHWAPGCDACLHCRSKLIREEG